MQKTESSNYLLKLAFLYAIIKEYNNLAGVYFISIRFCWSLLQQSKIWASKNKQILKIYDSLQVYS